MLSMKAKYALRALMVLGKGNTMMATKALAEEADVPAKFLETILQDLRHHGVVDSKRGIFGGYFLRKTIETTTVGEVVRILDGPLAPIRCASVTAFSPCDDCHDVDACAVRKTMLEVRNAIADVLDRKTLADLISAS
ncbi:MAG: RrF2 family transcriptional regulator [Holosporales bacterium]|jgi:Rrf2 family protein